MSCLYILKSNPFLVTLFANIFSHSEGGVFMFYMVSFAVQKLLSLIRAHLFIFGFIFITYFIFILYFITFSKWTKKILLQFMSASVLPVFFYKSFIVGSLKFRCLTHFEFIFVYGVENVLISFFYM